MRQRASGPEGFSIFVTLPFLDGRATMRGHARDKGRPRRIPESSENPPSFVSERLLGLTHSKRGAFDIDGFDFVEIDDAVEERFKDAKSDGQRDKYGRYFATIPCATCGGKRLRREVIMRSSSSSPRIARPAARMPPAAGGARSSSSPITTAARSIPNTAPVS